MAFSDFKYPKVVQELGLTLVTPPHLFPGVPGVPPGEALRLSLAVGGRLGSLADTTYSRAVWMVGPVLADVWDRYGGRVGLIAGAEFDADPAPGLGGVCDYVIGDGPHCHVVRPPVRVVGAQARGDDWVTAAGPCIAAMVGAQRYNRRERRPVDPVHGFVTGGSTWRFLRLDGTTLTMDLTEYYASQVDRILGILVHMIGPPPASAPAAA